MHDFKNKPIKDWTLSEAKEYCNYRFVNEFCNKECELYICGLCGDTPRNINFNKCFAKFSSDEIAFCRLIKKTCPWANYIVRTSCDNIFYIELIPKLSDDKSYFIIGTTGKYTQINSDFFPQIKPLTYYAIDDIIKQEEG